MEVPENTTSKFDLVLTQPVQSFNPGYGKSTPMMDSPLHTRCTFEWTGQQEYSLDTPARIYQLTKIST